MTSSNGFSFGWLEYQDIIHAIVFYPNTSRKGGTGLSCTLWSEI